MEKVNIEKLKDENIDFLFLSSYVMDTFVKKLSPKKEVKRLLLQKLFQMEVQKSHFIVILFILITINFQDIT